MDHQCFGIRLLPSTCVAEKTKTKEEPLMAKIIRTFRNPTTTVQDIRRLIVIATPFGVVLGAAINMLR